MQMLEASRGEKGFQAYRKSGGRKWTNLWLSALACGGQYHTLKIRVGRQALAIPANPEDRGTARICKLCSKQLECIAGGHSRLRPGDIPGMDIQRC
jgi:hypothetical protein